MKVPINISDKKTQELERRMQELGIREADLDEEFIRGSGPGGQKVNKTSAVVLLTHRPSGLQVRCQHGRSQALNRFHARRLLVDKIEEKIRGERSRVQQKIEKLRRQKRKRSKRAKDKMLQGKRHEGEKKKQRRKPSVDD